MISRCTSLKFRSFALIVLSGSYLLPFAFRIDAFCVPHAELIRFPAFFAFVHNTIKIAGMELIGLWLHKSIQEIIESFSLVFI